MNKNIAKTIGQNIKNARKAKGLTQKDVAEKFFMTQQQYSRFENGIFVTRVSLDGRDISIPGEVKLEGKRKIELIGPGRLTASITGPREVSLELSGHAVLINLTATPYPESRMKYVLNGACYLNFKNLDPPADRDHKNIWVHGFNGNGTPSFRFRGPDSYEEVRKEDKKFALEAMRKGFPSSY